MIFQLNGVIIEPVSSVSGTVPIWPFVIGSIFAASLFTFLFCKVDEAPLFPWGVAMFAVLLCLSALVSVFLSLVISSSITSTSTHNEEAAEMLSKHTGLKITASEVEKSGLLEVIGSDTVTKLEFFNDVSRDPDTGEWSNEVRSFLVDGKVVEVGIKFTPLEEKIVESSGSSS